MFQIQGKYTSDCKVFIDEVEDSARTLIQKITDSPAFADAKIRIMPDTHAGRGIVIGFTAPLDEFVNPNHVGVDIGCTIDTWFTDVKVSAVKLERLERDIRKNVKFGQEYHERSLVDTKEFYKYINSLMRKWRSAWPEMIQDVTVDDQFVESFCRRIGQDAKVFWKSLGTVGSGNHFIEVGAEPAKGRLVFTIHTGSRNLGNKIARYHEAIARRSGEYLTGDEMSDYLTDMAIGVTYAQYNHDLISRLIVDAIKRQAPNAKVIDMVRSIHNYIDFTDHIIRKGAIRAYEGERCVIPFNMRDGLAICRGKSNPDWNNSAPHGAGRVMSRSAAKKHLSVDDFAAQMQGIVSTSVGAGTIDEAPDAYKSTELIQSLIAPTVEILYLIRPLINLKDKNTVEDKD